jgi:hypothetical protein
MLGVLHYLHDEEQVVPVSRWRPDTDAEASAVTTLWGGVAGKK